MNRFSTLPFNVLVFYLSTLVLEGPLRFALNEIGFPSAIYLRDVALFLVVVLAFFSPRSIGGREINLFLTAIVLILLLHTIWGVFYLNSFAQAVFGLKLFLPVIFGVVCYKSFQECLEKRWWVFFILFIVSSGGIIWNYFFEMPWAGMTYEVAGVTLRGVKDWYAGEFRRLYGFGRASGTVAVQVLFFWLISVIFLKNTLAKVIVTFIASVAIVLTTTKGIWLAFIVVIFYFIMKRFLHEKCFLKKVYVVSFWVLGITVPLLFLMIDFSRFELDGPSKFMFSSFVDRGVNTWPRAAELLYSENALLLGRGVGGAGTPQMYFERHLYNPGDSLFIYWWMVFGVLSVVYYFVLLAGLLSLRTDEDSDSNEFFYICLALSFLVYNLTTYVLESGEFSCFSGLLFSALFFRSSRFRSSFRRE